jgi:hypothetical protein
MRWIGTQGFSSRNSKIVKGAKVLTPEQRLTRKAWKANQRYHQNKSPPVDVAPKQYKRTRVTAASVLERESRRAEMQRFLEEDKA